MGRQSTPDWSVGWSTVMVCGNCILPNFLNLLPISAIYSSFFNWYGCVLYFLGGGWDNIALFHLWIHVKEKNNEERLKFLKKNDNSTVLFDYNILN